LISVKRILLKSLVSVPSNTIYYGDIPRGVGCDNILFAVKTSPGLGNAIIVRLVWNHYINGWYCEAVGEGAPYIVTAPNYSSLHALIRTLLEDEKATIWYFTHPSTAFQWLSENIDGRGKYQPQATQSVTPLTLRLLPEPPTIDGEEYIFADKCSYRDGMLVACRKGTTILQLFQVGASLFQWLSVSDGNRWQDKTFKSVVDAVADLDNENDVDPFKVLQFRGYDEFKKWAADKTSAYGTYRG
jgi:hypothetical protein